MHNTYFMLRHIPQRLSICCPLPHDLDLEGGGYIFPLFPSLPVGHTCKYLDLINDLRLVG